MCIDLIKVTGLIGSSIGSLIWLLRLPHRGYVGGARAAIGSAGSRLIVCYLCCRPGMDLQYKYVVRNGDGSVARWMSGDNFSLQTGDGGVELPSTLRVSDSWDASVHAVEVWEHRIAAVCSRFWCQRAQAWPQCVRSIAPVTRLLRHAVCYMREPTPSHCCDEQLVCGRSWS